MHLLGNAMQLLGNAMQLLGNEFLGWPIIYSWSLPNTGSIWKTVYTHGIHTKVLCYLPTIWQRLT